METEPSQSSASAASNLQDMFSELQIKMEHKQDALKVAEDEYNKLCGQIEDNIRSSEEVKSQKYVLEGHLKSAEFRLTEYEKTEKEFEEEIAASKEKIDSLKSSIRDQEIKDLSEDSQSFGKNVIHLANKISKEHEKYDRNLIEEEIEKLQQSSEAVLHELSEVQQRLETLVRDCPLIDSEDAKHVIKNCTSSRRLLDREISMLLTETTLKENQNKVLEKRKKSLETEISRMKARIAK